VSPPTRAQARLTFKERARDVGDVLFGFWVQAREALPLPIHDESDFDLVDTANMLAEGLERVLRVVYGLEALETLFAEHNAQLLGADSAPVFADLCFAARIDLQQTEHQLRDARQQSVDSALIACERAHRRVMRAMEAVLHALTPFVPDADYEQHFHDEVRAALRVRQSYARLSVLFAQLDEAGLSCAERLQQAGDAVDRLLHSAGFDDVRLSDKCMFWRLQSRLSRLSQMRSTTQQQLWSDLVNAAHMLRTINQRQVLQTHDETCWRAIDDVLRVALDDDASRAALDVQTQALFGSSIELDLLLTEKGAQPWDKHWQTRLSTCRPDVDEAQTPTPEQGRTTTVTPQTSSTATSLVDEEEML